jgi:hypothetical protein
MPILNYTTTVPVLKSLGEIQGMLVAAGVKKISVDYEGNEPSAVYFIIDINGEPVPFRLPCNWRGVLAAMSTDRKIDRRYRTEQHAKLVAWRIVKNWVAAQLAFIQAGQAEMAEVFMPYVMIANNQTLFQAFKQNTRLLTAGKPPDDNVVEGKFNVK